MSEYTFSFDSYRKLCRLITDTGLLCDYKDVLDENREKFIIVRHDVEFSPERAFLLAEVEKNMGIHSTYFFQVTNNAYNMLSKKNTDLVKKILNMGHHVGLHFHLNGMTNLEEIDERIKYEAEMLSFYLQTNIDRFSFHRPSPLVLKNSSCFNGLINAYAPEFFSYYEDGMENPKINIKYVADSKNKWQYTEPYEYPNKEFFEKYDKIQILCHPYSWTDYGYDTFGNLKSLVGEKEREFIETLDSETKYVREYLTELQAEFSRK